MTATATATPTNGGAECGNGFLEPGENFDEPGIGLVGDPNGEGCPADAVIASCAPATQVRFDVAIEVPPGTSPSSVSIVVGYRSDRVSLPGSGIAASLRQRITSPPPAPFVFTPNDRDYAVRVVLARTTAIGDGTLLMISFDTCTGAPAVTAADFGCIIESCGGSAGSIEGCTCTIVAP